MERLFRRAGSVEYSARLRAAVRHVFDTEGVSMRHHRLVAAAAALVATAALIPVTGANATDATDATAATSQQENDTGGEYVVAFDTANQDQALGAITDAGGVVMDVLAPVGLALV